MSKKILVSACLLGVNCRYDGTNAYRKESRKFFRNKCLIFACPEQLGGLSTPRPKNMLKGHSIVNESGVDVTKNFYRGAREFLKIAKKFGVKKVVLKSRSPSCGKNGIVTRLLPPGIKAEYLR